jgi:hypothetical protein
LEICLQTKHGNKGLITCVSHFDAMVFHEIGHIRAQCTHLTSMSQGPPKVWRTNSTIGRSFTIEAMSVEGRKEKVQLDPDEGVSTSNTIRKLAQQPSQGMDNLDSKPNRLKYFFLV